MRISFSPGLLLLAGFVVLLSLSASDALPVAKKPRMITLPLHRLHRNRDDIHPLALYQVHANRAITRLARFTGTVAPSAQVLRDRVVKRLWIPKGGVPKASKNKNGKRQLNLPSARVIGVGRAKHHLLGDGGTPGSDNEHNNDHGVTSGGQTPPPDTSNSSSSSSSSDTSGSGFSIIDLEASISGDVAIANDPKATNSLGLSIEGNDIGYLASVQIGTPPREFLVLMDSGSSDFWVGAENCQTLASQGGGDCGNHTFLGSDSSSSFSDTGNPFQVTYGSGSVSGDIIQDNVNFAGFELDAHTFGVATTESQEFSTESPADGLMGLALGSLSQQNSSKISVPTPVQSLVDAGLISEGIVSFKISRLSDGKNDGEVTFGGLDSSQFDQSTLVTLQNVNKQGFWEGSLDGASADGIDLGLSGKTAIFDTGTTLIVVPLSDAETIHTAIPGALQNEDGSFTVPCTTSVNLALTFGGHSFSINPQDLAFLPIDPNDLTGDCQSGIVSGQIGGPDEWLLGDVFLKSVYLSTNFGSSNASPQGTTISLAELV